MGQVLYLPVARKPRPSVADHEALVRLLQLPASAWCLSVSGCLAAWSLWWGCCARLDGARLHRHDPRSPAGGERAGHIWQR